MPSPLKKTKPMAAKLSKMVEGYNSWTKQWGEDPYDLDEIVPMVDQRMVSINHTRLLVGRIEVPHGGWITLMAEWQEDTQFEGAWHMNWLSVAFDGRLDIAYQRIR